LRDALSGFIDLAASGAEPLHIQIARQIKAAVLAGKLPPQSRIPSSRALAEELGVSRNTVVSALERLKAEGYLDSRPGAAMRVAEIRAMDLARAEGASRPAAFVHTLSKRWQSALGREPGPLKDAPAPFQPGIPALDLFPNELWGQLLRRASRNRDRDTAGYGHLSGVPRFREALCQHLVEARGVVARPEQIIVTSSARGGVSLIASALIEPGDEAWIEEPGFNSAKVVFAAAGCVLRGVPVDACGIDVDSAPKGRPPRLIYTTPSHQYPTGALMSLTRRLELLDLASRHNAYVIEDDYDSEFQFTGRPIASLQGLDRTGCVLYLGTFAKSLLPSLRVGFVVAPPGLAESLARVHRRTGQLVPPVIQLALADLLESGQYRAHIRRARTVYAERLAAFVERIGRHSGGRLTAAPRDGGLQTVVTSTQPVADTALAAKLGQAGIQCQPLSELHFEPGEARHRGVLMGFAAWGEEEADRAFARLGALYRQRTR
jgi:GntR family transcriptional regulator / MocR family aminotransferase